MKNNNDNRPEETALNYIKNFQNGKDFKAPSDGIIINGRPDKDALGILKKYLISENAQVRENIVKLLVDIGLHSDSMSARNGLEVIHNTDIIKILAVEGLAKSDAGRGRTLRALRKLGMESELTPFGEIFFKVLMEEPREELFLLIAKAKTRQAKELVDQLVLSDEWRNVNAARIAKAALGDIDVAEEFIKAMEVAEATNNADKFVDALGNLSLIGTPEILKIIAGKMRTSLVVNVPGVHKKTARLDVMEALRYNFPDQAVLYPNNIVTDTDYASTEKFCIDKFGIKFTVTRPPFMTYIGYPRFK